MSSREMCIWAIVAWVILGAVILVHRLMTSAMCGPADFVFWFAAATNVVLIAANGCVLLHFMKIDRESLRFLKEAMRLRAEARRLCNTWKFANMTLVTEKMRNETHF